MRISLPMQLVLCVAAGLILGDHLNPSIIASFLTASTLIKDTLMWVLPFVVWTYLSSAILSFRERALWMMLSIVGLMIASNATALITVYGVGHLCLPWFTPPPHMDVTAARTIEAFWQLPFAPLIKPETAIVVAIFTGIVGCMRPQWGVHACVDHAKRLSLIFLNKCLIPLLPIYVLGFVLKLDYEGSLSALASQCVWIFALGWGVLAIYLIAMYWVAAGFSAPLAGRWIKNMLPAGLTGFSTMSSMATLPLTIEATEKNLGQDHTYANLAIPTTVNSHLVGDNINIGLTALALLWITHQPLPNLHDYIIFIGAYCLVKFSAVGVPGGGVIVILPVLRDYLNLPPETTTLLATLYIVQDSLLTGANVMGNGAFALISRRILKPLLRKQNLQKPSMEASS